MNTSLSIRLCGIVLTCLLCACSTNKPVNKAVQHDRPLSSALMLNQTLKQSGYICANAGAYRSKVIGAGHCVSLIQHCSSAPQTRYWRQGERVKGKALYPGTVIATFDNGRYPNKTGWHAAIYISQDAKGIWVWDQWLGKSVHKRLIRFKSGRGTPNNDGDAYHVVY